MEEQQNLVFYMQEATFDLFKNKRVELRLRGQFTYLLFLLKKMRIWSLNFGFILLFSRNS